MIKKIINKLLFGYKATSESYINYLKKIGVKIGEDCYIFYPKNTCIDTNNPHLLQIGNNVKITGPTTILTHDYSICVLNHLDKKIYGKQKLTIIGDNVFLGWGCTILCGSIIGNNTIIGAGSIVSGILEENSIYAGNPAKRICGIDEYRKKIQKNQLIDARKIYCQYKKLNSVIPPREIFHEYFYLFSNNDEGLSNIFVDKLKKEKIIFKNKKSYFKNYEEFCKYCEGDKK